MGADREGAQSGVEGPGPIDVPLIDSRVFPRRPNIGDVLGVAMVEGDEDVAAAIRAGDRQLDGPPALRLGIYDWIGLRVFAKVALG